MTLTEKLIQLLHVRDAKMRGYNMSVDDGFEGGYPAEWDEPILATLTSLASEAVEALPEIKSGEYSTDVNGDAGGNIDDAYGQGYDLGMKHGQEAYRDALIDHFRKQGLIE